MTAALKQRPRADEAASVAAKLNFVPAAFTQASYEIGPDGKRPYEPATIAVPIHDEGPRRAELSLDREGYVLVPFVSATTDYKDSDQLFNIWSREVAALLKQMTGADHVITFAQTTRHSAADPTARNAGMTAPAKYVHSDWGPNQFAPDVTHAVVKAEIEKLLQGRRPRKVRPYNVWQAISPPPFDTPLALCDARTVSPQDYCLTYFDASPDPETPCKIEVPAYKYSPAQRWVYFPDMQNELLIFSGLDMDAGPNWRMVPHTAFDNPACPAGSAPRENAELRAVAVFE